jgi:hypothetical protein
VSKKIPHSTTRIPNFQKIGSTYVIQPLPIRCRNKDWGEARAKNLSIFVPVKSDPETGTKLVSVSNNPSPSAEPHDRGGVTAPRKKKKKKRVQNSWRRLRE